MTHKQQQNLCKCGCKQECNKIFCHGHNRKGVKYQSKLRGRGKPRINWANYILIRKPNYYMKTKSRYVRFHRLVYEEFYKCCLLPYTVIHHKDGNKQNNSIKNLEPMYKKQHDRLSIKLRPLKDMSNRICLFCNTKECKRLWIKYEDGFICKRCYDRLYHKKKKELKN